MSAKKQLNDLAARLRTSADLYRAKGNKQDKHACGVEVLAELSEEHAQKALEALLKEVPEWFKGVPN